MPHSVDLISFLQVFNFMKLFSRRQIQLIRNLTIQCLGISILHYPNLKEFSLHKKMHLFVIIERFYKSCNISILMPAFSFLCFSNCNTYLWCSIRFTNFFPWQIDKYTTKCVVTCMAIRKWHLSIASSSTFVDFQ